MRTRTFVASVLISIALVVCGTGLTFWFRVIDESGAWLIVDRVFVPTLLALCLSVGAILLWRRTVCWAALTQVVASAILVVTTLSEDVRTFSAPGATHWLMGAAWSQPWLDLTWGIHCVCTAAFGVAYVWYAFGRQRI